jgi:hypothetical protein
MKATELGITRKELNALKKVRDGLREGLYRHLSAEDVYEKKDNGKPVFNMSNWATSQTCGTVGCIGGWMEAQLKAPRYSWDWPETLHPLFHPLVEGNEWERITPKKAARAIDNFIETGDPQWAKVLKL